MNKKGFTLIELIAAIAIGAIVMAAAGSLFLASYQIYIEVEEDRSQQQIIDSIRDVLTERLRFATRVVIQDGPAPGDQMKGITSEWIRVAEIAPNDDKKDLFSTEFYRGYLLEIKFTKTGRATVAMHIELFRDYEHKAEGLQRDVEIKVLNIDLFPDKMVESVKQGEHAPSGNVIYYK